MDLAAFSAGLPAGLFALACAITGFAAFVKGATGFAMPMIMISGLGSFLTPELALAALILPTLVTNLMQAFRDGTAAAWAAVKTCRLFFVMGGIFLVLSGQLVTTLDPRLIFAMIGLPITGFGLAQLLGWVPRIPPDRRRRTEVILGCCSGVVGGISGVWGPPLVLYLTALGTPKAEQVRIQGVAFGLAAVLLASTHLQTGVLNAATLPFSAVLLLPALAGMFLGRLVHDRLDQSTFRKATLVVLIVAGLNLLRRALT
ncbi:sulfite exporter TauE/SafE family protein [Tropicimonas sp. IMCC6043]|uniref:sulfite exporter TauE/SafE family protein n=1 Tax=Tropicimonas sp. IMCC6043 TaxID=2510645 RepID=UPI00101CCBB1|nr:sulfite exporter TauE/SafE family protein [Tropicimonas sp. IMCC6043]RYH11749.1 sulfite exporter TauE/SafE family protein [Tropicimonas sp. IMCC6043]